MDRTQLSVLVIWAVVLCALFGRLELMLATFLGIFFALHGRNGRINPDLTKLIRAAVLFSALIAGSMGQDERTIAVWVALLVLYVCFWGEFTGGAELLRLFGVGLLWYFASRGPRIYLIGPSIKNLGCLVSLNMKSCNVDQLPDLGFMKALKELVIDGTFIDTMRFQKGSMEQLETLSACKCERLEQIYEIDHLQSLSNLALDGAAIKTLPVSIGSLEKLQRLSLRNCQILSEIPRSIGKLKKLQFMDLSNTGVDELPRSVEHLENLKVLKMEGTHIGKFPEAIQTLPKLEEIDFSLCRNLEIQMGCDLAGLSSLRVLKLSYTQISYLPESICCLSNLQMLELLNCKKLQAPPKFRSSVIILR